MDLYAFVVVEGPYRVEELHKFERRPLYTEMHLANGISFRILGVHLKNKEVFNAQEGVAWWDQRGQIRPG